MFSCNWDGWSCIDAAANAGLTYPASVAIIRLMCLSSINAGFLLRAFEHGAGGVMLLGCRRLQCEHGQYSDNIEGECTKAGELLELMGLEKNKIAAVKLDPFDGNGFIEQLDKLSILLASGSNESNARCPQIRKP